MDINVLFPKVKYHMKYNLTIGIKSQVFYQHKYQKIPHYTQPWSNVDETKGFIDCCKKENSLKHLKLNKRNTTYTQIIYYIFIKIL